MRDPYDLDASVHRYLRLADRVLRHRIVGLYIVGSSALGAYVPGASDIDLVVVVDRGLRRWEVQRIRVIQWWAGIRPGLHAIRTRNVAVPGTCNASYIEHAQVSRPVSAIQPIASHVGHEFHVGEAFDVNPVVWREFAAGGIAVRGPSPADLGLDPEPHTLREWNLDNLDTYWRRLGERLRDERAPRWWSASSTAEWSVLGVSRLHCTISTGEVVSKEDAGRYARDTFDERWHPLIEEALSAREGRRVQPAHHDRGERIRATGEFVLEVVQSAHEL